jgi:hypothetical protein
VNPTDSDTLDISDLRQLAAAWRNRSMQWEAECQKLREKHHQLEDQIRVVLSDLETMRGERDAETQIRRSLEKDITDLKAELDAARAAGGHSPLPTSMEDWTQRQRPNIADPKKDAPQTIQRSKAQAFTPGCQVQLKKEWILGDGRIIPVGQTFHYHHAWRGDPQNYAVIDIPGRKGGVVIPHNLLTIITQ